MMIPDQLHENEIIIDKDEDHDTKRGSNNNKKLIPKFTI